MHSRLLQAVTTAIASQATSARRHISIQILRRPDGSMPYSNQPEREEEDRLEMVGVAKRRGWAELGVTVVDVVTEAHYSPASSPDPTWHATVIPRNDAGEVIRVSDEQNPRSGRVHLQLMDPVGR